MPNQRIATQVVPNFNTIQVDTLSTFQIDTSVNAKDDKIVWNTWYPIGVPSELAYRGATHTRLLDHEIELQIKLPHISASCGGKALPLKEQLGYVWTTLGDPEISPQTLPEYDEPDRLVMNVFSSPIKSCGLRIVDNVLDNAHFPFVHPGIHGDEDHLELSIHETSVDENGVLWSHSRERWYPLTQSMAVYSYRVSNPYSVILLIHRPKIEGEEQRYDYVGVFTQPTSEENFILHKMYAGVKENWMDQTQMRADEQWVGVQDKYVIEKHNPKKLVIDENYESPISVDIASLAYHNWLRENQVQYGVIYEKNL